MAQHHQSVPGLAAGALQVLGVVRLPVAELVLLAVEKLDQLAAASVQPGLSAAVLVAAGHGGREPAFRRRTWWC